MQARGSTSTRHAHPLLVSEKAQLSIMPTRWKLDLIRLRIELFVFVASISNNRVFFIEPSTEIDQLTTLTAKRHEFGVGTWPNGLVASRTTW